MPIIWPSTVDCWCVSWDHAVNSVSVTGTPCPQHASSLMTNPLTQTTVVTSCLLEHFPKSWLQGCDWAGWRRLTAFWRCCMKGGSVTYNTAGTECWNLKLKCNMCAWAENVFLLSTVLLTIIHVYKAERVADGSLATRDWATVRSVP